MAAQLKQDWNLLALRVDLLFRDATRVISLQLQKHSEGVTYTLGGWLLDAANAERPQADLPLVDPGTHHR